MSFSEEKYSILPRTFRNISTFCPYANPHHHSCHHIFSKYIRVTSDRRQVEPVLSFLMSLRSAPLLNLSACMAIEAWMWSKVTARRNKVPIICVCALDILCLILMYLSQIEDFHDERSKCVRHFQIMIIFFRIYLVVPKRTHRPISLRSKGLCKWTSHGILREQEIFRNTVQIS